MKKCPMGSNDFCNDKCAWWMEGACAVVVLAARPATPAPTPKPKK